MSAHTVDEILAASAAWVWFPRDSEHVREHLLLVRDPERFGGGVRGSQVESSLSPAEVVDHALEQVRAVDTVNVPVWQQRPLDAEGLQAEFAEVTAALEAREGFRVLARIGDRAVSTGGCTIDDGFVRLWGASTLATDRGRGAYRAVLAERLRRSATWGAKTALVKGRISTSAPILARAGFTHYGDERAYRLNPAA